MATEVAYDSVLNVFNHDKSRGKWPSKSDFLFACIGHAFKVDAVFILPSLLLEDLGLYGIIPYFLLLGICVVPVVFIQSYLGQFSSTGFISVFRISPLFKSIGYVALVVNVVVLTYFSIYGAIPLFYLFHSLRPTLPWSCEGSKEWMKIKNSTISPCYENHTAEEDILMEVPSLEFFKGHLKTKDMHTRVHPEATFSFPLMSCSILVWIAVGAVLIQPIEVIARFLRYTCIATLAILGLCVLRFAFLPGAFTFAMDVLFDAKGVLLETFAWMPLIALSALGPGWGNILTMASYNKFKGDTLKYSWHLCLAQSGVMFGLGFMAVFVMGFLQKIDPHQIYFHWMHTQWMEFLITPTALSFLELSRIWCWLFFTMMLLGSLNLLTVQLFSVLTSLFDEFESLRSDKRNFTLIFVGSLALSSIAFCFNMAFTFSELIALFIMVTQMGLNLLLLLVVLWVFGRERFQRDITFMTDVVYATWKVHMMRFMTPIFLLVAMVIAAVYAALVGYSTPATLTIAFGFSLICWLFIPGYSFFTINRVKECKRAAQPVDWYPADEADRQKYEEYLSETPEVVGSIIGVKIFFCALSLIVFTFLLYLCKEALIIYR